MNTLTLLSQLGVDLAAHAGSDLISRSPVDGVTLASLRCDTRETVAKKVGEAHTAFMSWRNVPAPGRGELVRLLGDELRANKDSLGRLITLESGKILQEGLGEVQEMIDICDFAVGLSRQLYGLTIASERPGHQHGLVSGEVVRQLEGLQPLVDERILLADRRRLVGMRGAGGRAACFSAASPFPFGQRKIPCGLRGREQSSADEQGRLAEVQRRMSVRRDVEQRVCVRELLVAEAVVLRPKQHRDPGALRERPFGVLGA